MPFRWLAGFVLFGFALNPGAVAVGQTFTAKDRQPTPEELAKLPAVTPGKDEELRRDVKVPDDFDFTIFATPPAVNYPVFVSAAPNNTIYVSSDGNGSLDRKPHLGRVLRVRDTNGDGKADEVKAFVPDIDSPRGLVWDHDRLYLLHPPDISMFVDKDGDGVMDERKTLVKGIAFTFKDRPADHSSNGLELGVDGWLYAAIGDFGFMEAVGTDGKKLQLRGGGVVRVRPDGTELELFANGTRNILEAAVSPLLDVFARDNTNDGGGWDVRFHHFSGYTEHGYPKLFKNFSGDYLEPLADYGGGSGCGAAWIDEPGIPARWNNAPFTADWGREWVYHHGLKAKGATYSVSQDEFIRLPRVTDLDVDANSAVYALSWKGASFTWVGPEVGFVVRLTPKGYVPPALPGIDSLSPVDLVRELESLSHTRRMEAQRALIRSGAIDGVAGRVRDLARDGSKPLASRVAAIFLLKQTQGARANEDLMAMLPDTTIAPWVLRALTDRLGQMEGIWGDRLEAALAASEPRLRKEAAIALGRLGDVRRGAALVRVLSDSDTVVAHTAVQSLVRLKAVEACLRVIDDGESVPAVRTGALRVLQSIHEARVTDALISRLDAEKDAERRAGLITALSRLYFVEGPWKGDSWGTRPDTRGPYYQPEAWAETPKIATALRATLDRAGASEAALIGRELARHRIPAGDALEKLLARAATDESLRPALASQLADAESIPANAVPLLVAVATGNGSSDASRAQAVIALSRSDAPEGWRAILSSMKRVQQTQTENNLAERARNAVQNSARLDQVHAVFESVAAAVEGDASQLAETMLLRLSAKKIGAPEAREAAARSIELGWANPKRRIQILKASAQIGDASRAAKFVEALQDPDAGVAEAAKEAVKKLKIDPEKLRAATQLPKIGDMTVAAVLDTIPNQKGDRQRGEQLFGQLGCTGCHTVKTDEPLKGPFLGTIATIYKRRELAEAILVPNKTLAQGFVANHFELKDGSEVDGFVVREAADAVTVRTIAAIEQTIPVKEIVRREKVEKSLMPEGLAGGLTLVEFASLLDYLEFLSKK